MAGSLGWQSRLWFPLYKVSRVLKVSDVEDEDEYVDEQQNKENAEARRIPPRAEHSKDATTATNSGLQAAPRAPEPPSIKKVVSLAVKDFHITAVLCANSSLIVRFTGNAESLLGAPGELAPDQAIVRVSTYFSDANEAVVAVCIAPDATQVLVATASNNLYTVPLAPLLFPSARGCVDVNFPAVCPLGTVLKAPEKDGGQQPMSRIALVCTVADRRDRGRDRVRVGTIKDALWWKSKAGRDIAVVALSHGFVSFVDVKRGVERRCAPLPILPQKVGLCSDASCTTLFITGTRGFGGAVSGACNTAAMVLEQPQPGAAPWKDITLPFDKKMTGPPSPGAVKPPHQPILLGELAQVSWDRIQVAQLTEQKQGIIVFDSDNQQEVACYDASIVAADLSNPLYVYYAGRHTTCVHLTAATLVYAHKKEGSEHQKISVMSRYAAAGDPRQRAQSGIDSSVLQEVILPHDTVRGILPGPNAAFRDDDDLAVEGAIIWTDMCVFELVSTGYTPQEVFISTLLYGAKVSEACFSQGLRLVAHADSLAKAYRLDILSLYDAVARKCRKKHPKWSLHLYSKVGAKDADYVRQLATRGQDQQAVDMIRSCGKLQTPGFNKVALLSALKASKEERKHASQCRKKLPARWARCVGLTGTTARASGHHAEFRLLCPAMSPNAGKGFADGQFSLQALLGHCGVYGGLGSSVASGSWLDGMTPAMLARRSTRCWSMTEGCSAAGSAQGQSWGNDRSQQQPPRLQGRDDSFFSNADSGLPGSQNPLISSHGLTAMLSRQEEDTVALSAANPLPHSRTQRSAPLAQRALLARVSKLDVLPMISTLITHHNVDLAVRFAVSRSVVPQTLSIIASRHAWPHVTYKTALRLAQCGHASTALSQLDPYLSLLPVSAQLILLITALAQRPTTRRSSRPWAANRNSLSGSESNPVCSGSFDKSLHEGSYRFPHASAVPADIHARTAGVSSVERLTGRLGGVIMQSRDTRLLSSMSGILKKASLAAHISEAASPTTWARMGQKEKSTAYASFDRILSRQTPADGSPSQQQQQQQQQPTDERYNQPYKPPSGSAGVMLELSVLCILRAAQLCEEDDECEAADSLDSEALRLLKESSTKAGSLPQWGPRTIRRHAVATGRLGVSAWSCMASASFETAVTFAMVWSHRLLKRPTNRPPKPSSPEPHRTLSEVAHYATDFCRSVFTSTPGPSPTATRRCLRVLLAFYKLHPLPIDPLLRTLETPAAAVQLPHILTTSEAYLDFLPVSFKINVAQSCMQAEERTHDDPPKPPSPHCQVPDDFSATEQRERHAAYARGMPLDAAVLQQSGKPVVVFSCGHPHLSLDEYTAALRKLSLPNAPTTEATVKAMADSLLDTRSAPLACVQCTFEALLGST